MAAYCEDCHRIIGVGCACGLSFKEKLQTLRIDKHSLTSDDQQWRDYDRITGQDKRRRKWAHDRANHLSF